jgi:cytochrome P450
MLVGFETTSAALAYSTYVLAKHPDVQAKLRSEIDEHWKEGDEELHYEIVADSTYMDFFIREVLRIYRISGQNSTRQSDQAATVCGHQIDKGKSIIFFICKIKSIVVFGIKSFLQGDK